MFTTLIVPITQLHPVIGIAHITENKYIILLMLYYYRVDYVLIRTIAFAFHTFRDLVFLI